MTRPRRLERWPGRGLCFTGDRAGGHLGHCIRGATDARGELVRFQVRRGAGGPPVIELDHVHCVPRRRLALTFAQVTAFSPGACKTVGISRGSAPHPGPPSGMEQGGSSPRPGRQSPTLEPPGGKGSLRSTLRADPCRPGEPGVARRVPDRGDDLTRVWRAVACPMWPRCTVRSGNSWTARSVT